MRTSTRVQHLDVSQAEASQILRSVLTDPVSAAAVDLTIKQVSHLMPRCRREAADPGFAWLQAEFALLLGAAKLVASACDDVGGCVANYRGRAEREGANFSLELDLDITKLCRSALIAIILNESYPTNCRHHRRKEHRYVGALKHEIQRKRGLVTQIEASHLALAS